MRLCNVSIDGTTGRGAGDAGRIFVPVTEIFDNVGYPPLRAAWTSRSVTELTPDDLAGIAGWRWAGQKLVIAGSHPAKVVQDPDAELDAAAASLARWGPAGRRELEAACDRLEIALRDLGMQLLLRTGASALLSDVPGVLSLLRARSERGVGVCIDPVAMLTGDMLSQAEDHLGRMITGTLGMPGTGGVIGGVKAVVLPRAGHPLRSVVETMVASAQTPGSELLVVTPAS